MQGWLWLSASIVLEVAGTTSMKLSEGLTRLVPSVLIFVFYALSFTAFTFALKRVELSVAYAIWAGVGTALIALIGMVFFREPATLLRLSAIGLIILGVVLLNLAGNAH
jgi:small multidrug resistance pump